MMRSDGHLLLVLPNAVEVYANQINQAEDPAYDNSDFR